jgi:O-antigen ligase
LIFVLFAMERRAGVVALIVVLSAFGLLLLMVRRRVFLIAFAVALVGSSLYFPLFWNDNSLVGQPARAIHSIFNPVGRDAQSNTYRDLEKINIRATIDENPLLGVGFGREYLFVVPLPDLSDWSLWHFEPHNNVLWIYLKVGLIGFMAFLLLIGSAIRRASSLVVAAKSPQTQTVAVLALASILATLVLSYVDVGLVSSGRGPAMLGMGIGLLATLQTQSRSQA